MFDNQNNIIGETLRISLLIYTLFASILIVGCKAGGGNNKSSTSKHDINNNLTVNESVFKDRANLRYTRPLFDILDITREKEFLYVKIKGGSEAPDDYQFFWDGELIEVHPLTCNLLIKYKGEIQEYSSDRLSWVKIDISHIIKQGDKKPLQFVVYNASKNQVKILTPEGEIFNSKGTVLNN
ncbi:MAG TPA: hypothetical protein VK076_10600 [Candidatus Sphingobacterium stercoripullorum]|nr:hypothetical protein [Candidatus Sphingobacterium stercoripullorum]